MNSLVRLVFAGVAACMTSLTWAHASMKTASPEPGATLENAPAEIVIRFNEKLAAPFSSIKMSGPSGTDIPLKSHLDAADGGTLRAALPTLGTGIYKVSWRAVGSDGHLRKGEYTFSIR